MSKNLMSRQQVVASPNNPPMVHTHNNFAHPQMYYNQAAYCASMYNTPYAFHYGNNGMLPGYDHTCVYFNGGLKGTHRKHHRKYDHMDVEDYDDDDGYQSRSPDTEKTANYLVTRVKEMFPYFQFTNQTYPDLRTLDLIPKTGKIEKLLSPSTMKRFMDINKIYSQDRKILWGLYKRILYALIEQKTQSLVQTRCRALYIKLEEILLELEEDMEVERMRGVEGRDE